MSWDTGAANAGSWKPEPADTGNVAVDHSWKSESAATGNVAVGHSWKPEPADGSDTGNVAVDHSWGGGGECPDKPQGTGLTGECYNCGQVGHNKIDCPNDKVDRPFSGACNSCGQEGHRARDCPTIPIKCRLCDQEGHKALDCKSRRIVDWTGVPDTDAEPAWVALINAAKEKDLDTFRVCLRAYARATMDQFSLPAVEEALREDGLGVYLIARQQEVALNMTIVDLIGNPDRKFVLSIQLSEKPRRAKNAQGWPENPQQNLERLASAGFIQDRGIPLCDNCGELGHVRKHCKQEQPERETTQHAVHCVNCQEDGHRARDCTKERVNPHACKNCKQDGHIAKDCPEPRSAEGVECRKCNEIGHFSKDCPNVDARPPRTCRNCGSEDHIAKDCDQPRNPSTILCHNCEKLGHVSRECPEPKDWSKVKCSNCEQMGHTIKRCKAPLVKGAGRGDGGPVEAAGGWDTVGDAGGWDTVGDAIDGGLESSWDDGKASGGGGW